MTAATLTSKRRITTPADARRLLNVQKGDRIEFVQVEPGRFEMIAATRSVSELKGLFGKAAMTVSIDQMNRPISQHATRAAESCGGTR